MSQLGLFDLQPPPPPPPVVEPEPKWEPLYEAGQEVVINPPSSSMLYRFSGKTGTIVKVVAEKIYEVSHISGDSNQPQFLCLHEDQLEQALQISGVLNAGDRVQSLHPRFWVNNVGTVEELKADDLAIVRFDFMLEHPLISVKNGRPLEDCEPWTQKIIAPPYPMPVAHLRKLAA